MGGERNHQPDWIDRKANQMADMLDNREGTAVARMLQDIYNDRNVSAPQFNRLVEETRRMEQPRRGDDLEIVKGNGRVVVLTDRGGELPAGRMHAVVCADTSHGTKDGAVKGGLGGAIVGGLIGGDRKGIGIGAVVGALGGAAIGHENAKNDCQIVDNRRQEPRERFERR